MPSQDAGFEPESFPCGSGSLYFVTGSEPTRVNDMFSHIKWGLEMGRERPGWLSMGRGCLDSSRREKKMNFIISIGTSEPAVISVWESV